MSNYMPIDFSDLGTSFSEETGDNRRIAYKHTLQPAAALDPSDLTASLVTVDHMLETREQLDRVARKLDDMVQAARQFPLPIRIWEPDSYITLKEVPDVEAGEIAFGTDIQLAPGVNPGLYKYVWLQWEIMEDPIPETDLLVCKTADLPTSFDTSHSSFHRHSGFGQEYNVHLWVADGTLTCRVAHVEQPRNDALDWMQIHRVLFIDSV